VAGRAPAADDVARLLAAGGPADVRRGGLELFHAEDLDLVVVAPERHETDLLSGANERALAVERPWLQLVPHDGRVVVVGPVYLPGRSACHECYRLRRAAGSDYEEDFELVEHTPGRSASPAALVAVSAGLAALLALRWLATRDVSVPGRAYSIATRSLLELESHRVLRVPRCPACSPAEAALPSPWYRETVRDA
jgi:bacteriocin biosynthesis cyclodehydratase domain-containing protein